MKNKLYIAEWLDGTISIVSAKSAKDLFWKLDTESDPYDIKITELNFHQGDIHITTTKSKSKIQWDAGLDVDVSMKVVHDKKKRFFKGLGEMLGLDVEAPDELYKEMGLSKP